MTNNNIMHHWYPTKLWRLFSSSSGSIHTWQYQAINGLKLTYHSIFLRAVSQNILKYLSPNIFAYQIWKLLLVGWFNIKMLSYQYRKSPCGDETMLRTSYLHNGISLTSKTIHFYCDTSLHHPEANGLMWQVQHMCGSDKLRKDLEHLCSKNTYFRLDGHY